MRRHNKISCAIGLLFLTHSFASAFVLPRDEDRAPVKQERQFINYDSELYGLAYTTFLANKNLKSAFFLARAAVKQKPKSIKWRKRYAQVSSWNGYGDISMQQWMILVKKTNDPAIIKDAIKMANLTFDYPSLLEIYQYQLDRGVPVKKVVDGLSDALKHLGEPEQALALLKKFKNPSNKRVIQLQVELGRFEPVLKSLQAQQKKEGFSVHNSVQQAQVLFTMTRVKQAFLVLKEVASLAKASDAKYWELLAELAWKQSDRPIALISYERLYALNQRDEVLMVRLSRLLQKVAPQRGLQIALENWRLRPTLENLYDAASLSFSQKDWLLFYDLFNMLPVAKKTEHAELYIEWALAQHLNELAIDTANKAQRAGKVLPTWLKLSLAMRENDQTKIAQYLEDLKASEDAASYGDQSVAAYAIGHIESAQELAYMALETQPSDTSTYQYLRDVMLPHSNYIDVNVDHHQNGPIAGPEEYISTRYFIAPRFFIEPFARVWQTKSSDPTQIINPPNWINDFGVLAGISDKRSIYLGAISQRQAMRNFWQAMFAWQEQWDRFFSWQLSGGWQQKADETTALLVAGKKDTIGEEFTYRLTARDSLVTTFSQSEYYSQDSVYFGDGQKYRISWLHKFLHAYPDWNIQTYFSINQYRNTRNQSDVLNSILPSPSTEGPLPRNFNELGFVVGMGQVYREEYTHAFRPFFEIGVFRHSLNGIGQLAMAGIAGSIFGRDHLALYGNASRGEETTGQLDYSVGLEYRLYY